MGPDISMCWGKDCPLKESCYRFLATPNRWQSYGAFKYDRELDKCDNYWEVYSKSEKRRLDIVHDM